MNLRTLYSLLESLSVRAFPVDILWGRYGKKGKVHSLKSVFTRQVALKNFYEEGIRRRIEKKSLQAIQPERESMVLVDLEQGGRSHSLLWIEAPDLNYEKNFFIAIPFTISNTETFLEIFLLMETVMEKTSSLCCLIDGEGLIRRTSLKGEEFLGEEEEGLIGKNIMDYLISPSDISGLSVLSRGRENREVYLKGVDGKERLCIGSIIPFYDRRDEILFYFIAVSDISTQMNLFSSTMRNNMELLDKNDFLQRSQTALLKTEKLSSIGMLGSGLAHEINNPLSFILNDIQLLREFNEQLLDFADEVRSLKGDDPDVARIYKKYDLAYYASEVPEMLAEMKEGIDRIARIVNSLKSFSGLESRDEWNYVDINKSLDEMLIVSKNEYKYDIQVDFHRGTLPPIYCCDKELNQAFLSVFLNSIQAVAENRDRGESRGRGRIAIDTEFSSSRDAVLISFRDNGAPFPEEDMGKILDPFFSGWSGKGGSGLGLALVNDIVAFKHRGDVELFGGEDKRVLLAIPVNLNEIVGA